MKPWLNVGEGAGYAGLSRDTSTRPANAGNSGTRAWGAAIDCLKPEWIDAWLEGYVRWPGNRICPCMAGRCSAVSDSEPEEGGLTMGLYNLWSRRRARDRCKHAWWGSFRGCGSAWRNGRTAKSRPRPVPTSHSTN